jgi:general nucleoside transport system permease protein
VRAHLSAAARPLVALACAFLAAWTVIWATGGEPAAALGALMKGGFGSETGLIRTLAKATPLIFSGLAVAIALKAGLFNIGAEGQLLVGGAAAAWVGYVIVGLPTVVHLPLALLAGGLAGALWGLVPGVLKAVRGAHEVIVTIMMNYVAIHFTHYLVSHPLKDPSSDALRSPAVQASARLMSLDDLSRDTLVRLGITARSTHLSLGFLLAIAAAIFIWILVRRTALGFEIRAVGSNSDAARTAGISVPRTIIKTMGISGGLAGLAGAVEVLGVHRRFLDAFSPGYGFDSIAVALLGGSHAGWIVPSALLFGGVNSGAILMETATDTPRQMAGILQAIVIIAVGARYVRTGKTTTSGKAAPPNGALPAEGAAS